MKKLLVLSFILIFGQYFGQIKPDESKNFIILENDSVVYGENIEFFGLLLFEGNYLLADGVKYEIPDVRFYKNQEGTFGFVRGTSLFSYTLKVKRIVKGNLNLYENEINPASVTRGYNAMSPGTLGASKVNYYNKGYETLKLANYDNLSLDLIDNSESMKFLGEYKKTQNKQHLLLGAGIATSIAGVVTFAVLHNKNDSGFGQPSKIPIISYVLMGVGIGFDIGSFVFAAKKRKYLKAAIESYNGF